MCYTSYTCIQLLWAIRNMVRCGDFWAQPVWVSFQQCFTSHHTREAIWSEQFPVMSTHAAARTTTAAIMDRRTHHDLLDRLELEAGNI
jgi:hypothetical protein